MIEMTADGKAKLEEELEYLRTVVSAKVSEEIKEARAHGDLSENAEYAAAREKQAEIEGRIQEIEYMLRETVIIDEERIDTRKVSVGVAVRIKNTKTKQEYKYQLVSIAEAKISEGRISNESPVGAALIGHSVGETVEVNAPVGVMSFKILEISRIA